MSKYKSVKVNKGRSGWGNYIIVTPTDEKDKVISVTGGGIHPTAQRIAELSGGIAVDGFKNPPDNKEVFCAVVDCGGTLRAGLFPKLSIPTVNILDGGPAGPMADYCTEDNYVSGSKPDDIELADPAQATAAKGTSAVKEAPKAATSTQTAEQSKSKFVKGLSVIMEKLGRGIGYVVNLFFDGAREAVNMALRNIIPFILFISFIIGLMNATGFGSWVAKGLEPFTTSIGGLILFAIIIGIPVLSPLLAPGAVVQSILGTMIGTLIATGYVSPAMALPALFAISVVDACDFIPVAAALGEAKPETSRIAVPAMLFSRFITAPLAVLVGWVAGIGLF
ncbi:MAG: PTS sorbitol transporter subunit IIB [Clostridiales bacterium]|jgi:PTS system glucitol/sorbitol-specific IIC component|nr:PTS sorbitol transporter subunit IIB [Clostridiales bacterium]